MTTKKRPLGATTQFEFKNYMERQQEEMMRRRAERKRKNWTLDPNR